MEWIIFCIIILQFNNLASKPDIPFLCYYVFFILSYKPNYRSMAIRNNRTYIFAKFKKLYQTFNITLLLNKTIWVVPYFYNTLYLAHVPHTESFYYFKPSNNTIHAGMGTVQIHQELKSILSASYGVEMVQLSRTCKLNNFVINIKVYRNRISFVLALHTYFNHIILIN